MDDTIISDDLYTTIITGCSEILKNTIGENGDKLLSATNDDYVAHFNESSSSDGKVKILFNNLVTALHKYVDGIADISPENKRVINVEINRAFSTPTFAQYGGYIKENQRLSLKNKYLIMKNKYLLTRPQAF